MHVSVCTALPIALGVGWRYALVGTAVFLASFAISILVLGFVLLQIPATYFLDSYDRALWIDRHPAVRWSALVAKNVLGAGLVLLGLVLSIPGIPGQGLLTILIGIVLLDFPGKRRLERWLMSRPRVRSRIDALRRRFGKPPLVLEPVAADREEREHCA